MIKFIVSDVDGTLIKDGSNAIQPQLFELIEECVASDIYFAVASGRQYSSLKRLFAPVWKDIIFIPENGNVIMKDNNISHKVVFPKGLAKELIEYLNNIAHLPIVVSTPYSAYLLREPEWFVKTLVYDVCYTTTVLDSFDYLENEDVLKISVYNAEDNHKELVKRFNEDWGYHLQITYSGNKWIDFCLSGKGAAVRRLADDLGIKREQIMVFGDNFNDTEMFRAAGHSYAMSNALPAVQKQADYITDSVEKVIEHFLKTGEVLK